LNNDDDDEKRAAHDLLRKVLSVASRLKMLNSEPTKRTPMSVPTTPPTPPVSCVPPRATTVIASSSRPRQRVDEGVHHSLWLAIERSLRDVL